MLFRADHALIKWYRRAHILYFGPCSSTTGLQPASRWSLRSCKQSLVRWSETLLQHHEPSAPKSSVTASVLRVSPVTSPILSRPENFPPWETYRCLGPFGNALRVLLGSLLDTFRQNYISCSILGMHPWNDHVPYIPSIQSMSYML